MKDQSKNGKQAMNESQFMRYATKRMVILVIVVLAVLWLSVTLFGFFDKPETAKNPYKARHNTLQASSETAPATHLQQAAEEPPPRMHAPAAPTAEEQHDTAPGMITKDPHDATAEQEKHDVARKNMARIEQSASTQTAAQHDRHTAAAGVKPADQHAPQYSSYKPQLETAPEPPRKVQLPKGVAFIDAVIRPMNYELNERFWGWRPNDILNFTDNYNNFQLGVLEVTRRTAVILAERISRTGSTSSFDPNLQGAMNWFMIKADRYWFPSPESKYKAGLEEFREYRERLLKGEALFHTRADNLIPLLIAYEDLLGSCDENLVKVAEEDGSPVSHFQADDYFFYARGVVSAMYTILEAILEDFDDTLKSRRGVKVLHNAIESCHHAMQIDPLLITNSSLSGVLANHRANMAAPISHARFYLGVLITALST
jgi:hypothetical protein